MTSRCPREASPSFVLAIVLLFVSAFLLVQVIWPPSIDTTRELDGILGGVILVLALVTFVRRRSLGERWTVFVLLSGAVMLTLSTLLDVSGEGQLVNGFFVLLIGVFAAYFVRGRTFLVILAVAVLGYVVGLLVNPQMDVVLFGVMVIAMVVAVSVTIAHQVERIRVLVRRDPLTGVLNRRGFDEEAERSRSLSDREGRETCLVVIDLDGFKSLNDRRGHAAGDAVLVDAAAAWSAALRRGDVLGRMGGDEFAIVLPRASAQDADALVARLHEVNTVSWSSGCVVWRDGEELADALSRADALMYEHKSRSRGQGFTGS